MKYPLLLASTSPYRRRLLARLQIPFDVAGPIQNEDALPGENARDLALRLAAGKANSLASTHPSHFILGSDQTVACADQLLSKPLTRDRAIKQLMLCSGRTVHFHTAVALLNPEAPLRSACCDTVVSFRKLAHSEICRYLDREACLDCAGSFKVEALGICLFERISSEDPTALEGLPLISTARLLREAGCELP